MSCNVWGYSRAQGAEHRQCQHVYDVSLGAVSSLNLSKNYLTEVRLGPSGPPAEHDLLHVCWCYANTCWWSGNFPAVDNLRMRQQFVHYNVGWGMHFFIVLISAWFDSFTCVTCVCCLSCFLIDQNMFLLQSWQELAHESMPWDLEPSAHIIFMASSNYWGKNRSRNGQS